MSYNIELIIFENKNVETKEVFEKEFKNEVDEVLKFREVDLFYNKSSFNIKNKESFFTKLFADLNINRDVLNKESVDKKIPNPKEWFRKKSNLTILKKYETSLINSNNYKHLESLSWKQNIPSENFSKFLEYENQNKKYGFLIKLYKGRFLHVDLKAYLGTLPNKKLFKSDYTETYIDSFSYRQLNVENKNQDIKITLNEKNDYAKLNIDDSQAIYDKKSDVEVKIYIDEKRRVFNNDVHYFDHPRFGVILHISEDT
jgi:hypothetical protein